MFKNNNYIKGKVSVIIPSYNRFHYLMNAIKSVENQTYKNIEIIVVNDGSTQKEYYEPKNFQNVQIINIDRKNTINWGGSRPAVRNFGIDSSNGEFIAFLDDDDYWFPKKIERQLQEMNKNNVSFSCTEGYFGSGEFNNSKNYKKFNSEHHFKKIKKKYTKTKYLKFKKFPKIWTYDFLKHHNCVVLSSVVVRSDIIKQLGGFRGLYRTNQFIHTSDHDCWLGLLQFTDLVYVDEPMFYYDSGHGAGKNYEN